MLPWRLHHDLLPFANYSVTAPAWPEAQSIIYTDGSATGKTSKDGTAACKTGSGVYRAEPPLQLRVDPCGLGATNTITRAELVAIYCSLRHAGAGDCVIATDSQAGMYMIRNQLGAPGKNARSSHSVLLAAIAEELTSRARAGHRTRIIKIKSHTGVSGNEKADELANAARQPANCQEVVELGNVAHQEDFWPVLVQEGSRQLASNLCSGVKCHLGPCARGLANRTQYEGFWERVLPELHALSFIFWDAAGLGEACIREVWKARTGQTWHVGKAFLFGMLYNGMQVLHNACPLCGEEDSITHMLSARKHPLMVALYILRHDQAGRKILRAIHAGSRGSAETHADIGAADKLDSLETESKRVPASVLSDSDLPGGPGQRTKLRPDILLIEETTPGTQSGSAREEPAPKRTRRQASEWWVVGPKEQQGLATRGKKVTVVEVGYCADTRYHAKLEEKQEQHAQLKGILQAAGHEVDVVPLIFGTTGCIYKPCEDNLEQLGVSHDCTQRLLRTLALDAARAAHTIIKARRQHERKSTDSPSNENSRRSQPPWGGEA